MSDIKLLIKVDSSPSQWNHFCYIEESVYNAFVSIGNKGSINSIISRWCKEDFDVDNPALSMEEIQELKDLIKSHYKEKYPEVYRDSDTDRQGWVRVWVTEHMKKEIANGKESV